MSKGIISFPLSRPFSGYQGALDMVLQIPLLCLSAYSLSQLYIQVWLIYDVDRYVDFTQ